MLNPAVTVNIEGLELHFRSGTPQENGIPSDPSDTNLIRVHLGDIIIDLWLIRMEQYTNNDSIAEFWGRQIHLIGRDQGGDVPEANEKSQYDNVPWLSISPTHRVLHLDNLPD
jgi:hypothetical protein